MNQFVTKLSADLGVSWGLTLAYAVVTILVLVMCVVCLVLEIRVWWKYHQANQTPISCDMTGIDAARFVLDKAGLTGVRVRRAGTAGRGQGLHPLDGRGRPQVRGPEGKMCGPAGFFL